MEGSAWPPRLPRHPKGWMGKVLAMRSTATPNLSQQESVVDHLAAAKPPRGNRGNTREYLAFRIQRERPYIYQQFLAGKFPSVRAAATAAGIPDQNRLLSLRYHWQRATPEQKETFAMEIFDEVANDGGLNNG